MGEIVGAFGIPHNPHFPVWMQGGHPLAGEILTMYRPLALAFERMRPDTLVYITSDHDNMETLPVFAIGVAESAPGASDYPELPIDAPLAREIHKHLVQAEFDVTMRGDLEFDHTVIAPLHFLMPAHCVPVIPVYINAFLRPLPSADRCQALGRAIRAAIEESPATTRVAVAGSGSFSLGNAAIDDLVAEVADEQHWRVGDAGSEVLEWIAMLGTFDPRPPDYLDVQRPFGYAFASWSLDGSTQSLSSTS